MKLQIHIPQEEEALGENNMKHFQLSCMRQQQTSVFTKTFKKVKLLPFAKVIAIT
jgi:hypothetical protein